MAAIAGLKPLVGSTPVAAKASGGSCSVEASSVALPQLGVSRRVVRGGVVAGGRSSRRALVVCSSGDVSVSQSQSQAEAGVSQASGNWVPVIPLNALPRGERRLVRQDGETVLLLWYKNDVYAIENQSPAEGAYSEGLINARLTPVSLLHCPFSFKETILLVILTDVIF